jgi:hypothetical protein
MTSPYNKINRLRNQGLTWEALGRALSRAQNSNRSTVARNTLRSVQNIPHYNPGKPLIAAIDQVHDRYNPSPFPAGVNALMNLCRNLMQEDNQSYAIGKNLNSVEAHVEEQLERSKQPDLISCRLHWILGNISQFRMRTARINKESDSDIQTKQVQAIRSYQSATNYVDCRVLPIEHYKLQHNIFVCYVNAVAEEGRNENMRLIQQLSEIAYSEAAKRVINTEPFQWQTARNALLFASINKDRQGVANFFEALIMANRHFVDLRYQPSGNDPLLADPSLRWAVKNVLSPDLVQAIEDKVQRDKASSQRKNRHGRK